MARSKPIIPQRTADLTPDWFTSVLNRPGRVSGVQTTAIGTDIGFMGEIWRCVLTWDTADPELPSSVVVKVPSLKPENKALGEGLRVYEREIIIYDRLGDDLGIPMPDCHYGIMDPDPAPWMEKPLIWLLDTLSVRNVDRLSQVFLKAAQKSPRRYLLVIEDIRDARPPTQVEGGSLADSEAALRVLAGFHARNWMREEALDPSLRIQPLNTTPKIYQAAYLRNRDEFVEKNGARVGADVIARLDEVDRRTPEMLDALISPPWTILHGDFRLDNVLFRPDGDIVIIDYQLLCRGRPGFDIAYFITTALDPSHRAEEERLLRTYHQALVAAGVTDYSWDQLVTDCDMVKELMAHRFVGTGDTIETGIAGSDDSFIDVVTDRVLGWIS